MSFFQSRYTFIVLILVTVLAIGSGSCRKVININLNNAAKKYIIEGVITDKQGEAYVLISQTKNFEEDSSFAGVSGVVVTISDNLGTITQFTETSKGVYKAPPAFIGLVNNSYHLQVNINGVQFTANSTMPRKVYLDSLYVVEDDLFGSKTKLATVEFQDPIEKGNNYRFVQYINDKKSKDIFIRNDEYTNGNKITGKLRYNNEDDDTKKIRSGDIVTVDMLCIDADVYKYWYSLDQGATGNSGGATPANPLSNIQGGALGYFSAHTIDTKKVIVQ